MRVFGCFLRVLAAAPHETLTFRFPVTISMTSPPDMLTSLVTAVNRGG